MPVKILVADYHNKNHANAIAYLLNEYALDEMGGAETLSAELLNRVANELSKLPHAFSLIAFIDENPVGLVNCFEAFSTFNCKPLINIHDFVVAKEYRGKGLAKKMLSDVVRIATKKGCCKITLEVLDKNTIAMELYKKFGFSDFELEPKQGKALFWQKLLSEN